MFFLLFSFVQSPLTRPFGSFRSILGGPLVAPFEVRSFNLLILGCFLSGFLGVFEAGILLLCLPRPCALVLVLFLFVGLAPHTRKPAPVLRKARRGCSRPPPRASLIVSQGTSLRARQVGPCLSSIAVRL